jgi:two-component system, LytTR family, response regulator
MATCIIIDDEQHCIDTISAHIAQIKLLSLVFTTINPLEAIDFLLVNDVDIIFLDVNMPQMSGLDFLETYKGNGKIILSTAYEKYAVQGFDKEVADFLLKPVTFVRFMRGMHKALALLEKESYHRREPQDFVFVKTELKGKFIKIAFSEIDYIEGEKNYISFNQQGKKTLALLNMKDILGRLPQPPFIRVHNSYIVNFLKVKEVLGNHITLNGNNAEIPMGITYKQNVLAAMQILDRDAHY